MLERVRPPQEFPLRKITLSLSIFILFYLFLYLGHSETIETRDTEGKVWKEQGSERCALFGFARGRFARGENNSDPDKK